MVSMNHFDYNRNNLYDVCRTGSWYVFTWMASLLPRSLGVNQDNFLVFSTSVRCLYCHVPFMCTKKSFRCFLLSIAIAASRDSWQVLDILFTWMTLLLLWPLQVNHDQFLIFLTWFTYNNCYDWSLIVY